MNEKTLNLWPQVAKTEARDKARNKASRDAACGGHYRDRGMGYHMKYMAALLIALCVCLPNGVALAAAAQEQRAVAEGQAPDRQNDSAGHEAAAEVARAAPDNRASLLHIVLAGGLLIVVGNMVISFAKRKMERDIEAAKEKADDEGPEKRS